MLLISPVAPGMEGALGGRLIWQQKPCGTHQASAYGDRGRRKAVKGNFQALSLQQFC